MQLLPIGEWPFVPDGIRNPRCILEHRADDTGEIFPARLVQFENGVTHSISLGESEDGRIVR
jgi:hypothetical protein